MRSVYKDLRGYSQAVMRLTLDDSAVPSLLTESALQVIPRCIRGLS